MYSPMNPDPYMPAVPPLYPMYIMEPTYMSEPMCPQEPPCMPEPMPIEPPCEHIYPELPYTPEPVYPPNEMPHMYMCPLMRDPMLRQCVEMCMSRCRRPMYPEYPMEMNEIDILSHEDTENFIPQDTEE